MERYHPSEVYELFVRHMNTPRVVVDNGVGATATLVQVHSARKHRVLLQAVAALSDHGVCVRKGYISSDDGRWFMDVFHVTDAAGRKVADADALLARLESSLSADALPPAAAAAASTPPHTLLELLGADRPGLLSEVFAVLHDLRCDIVDARAWTHGGRVAALVFVRDEDTAAPIDDAARVRRVESRLRHVLRGGARGARMVRADADAVSLDRRLHQLLNEDGEADRGEPPTTAAAVAVQDWGERRGYSVLTVSCRDRPKLLFDVVCTLTDLDYVVYHGTFDTDGDHAQQVRSPSSRFFLDRCILHKDSVFFFFFFVLGLHYTFGGWSSRSAKFPAFWSSSWSGIPVMNLDVSIATGCVRRICQIRFRF
ncbi:hypothetical protein BS78_01G418400 [Paspalum vaginatum]|nr:hypothetical protein BS78_01G418400 [Paspalum vaginatum]